MDGVSDWVDGRVDGIDERSSSPMGVSDGAPETIEGAKDSVVGPEDNDEGLPNSLDDSDGA